MRRHRTTAATAYHHSTCPAASTSLISLSSARPAGVPGRNTADVTVPSRGDSASIGGLQLGRSVPSGGGGDRPRRRHNRRRWTLTTSGDGRPLVTICQSLPMSVRQSATASAEPHLIHPLPQPDARPLVRRRRRPGYRALSQWPSPSTSSALICNADYISGALEQSAGAPHKGPSKTAERPCVRPALHDGPDSRCSRFA